MEFLDALESFCFWGTMFLRACEALFFLSIIAVIYTVFKHVKEKL
jgi:hypothetical protein